MVAGIKTKIESAINKLSNIDLTVRIVGVCFI